MNFNIVHAASKLPSDLLNYSIIPENVSRINGLNPPDIDPLHSNIDPPPGDTISGYRWTALDKNGALVIHDLDEKAFVEFAAKCTISEPVSRSFAACVVVRINNPANFLQDFFVPMLSHEIRDFEPLLRPHIVCCEVLVILSHLIYLCIRMSLILLADVATLPIRLVTLVFRISTLMEKEQHPLQKKYNLPDRAELHFLAWRVSLINNTTTIQGNQKHFHYRKEDTRVQTGYCLDFVETPAYKMGHYFQVKNQRTENASVKIENLPPPPKPKAEDPLADFKKITEDLKKKLADLKEKAKNPPAPPPEDPLAGLKKTMEEMKQKINDLKTPPSKPEYPPFDPKHKTENVNPDAPEAKPSKPAKTKTSGPSSKPSTHHSDPFADFFSAHLGKGSFRMRGSTFTSASGATFASSKSSGPKTKTPKPPKPASAKPNFPKAPKASSKDKTSKALNFLGLPSDCSVGDVKTAYKAMALKCHPDKFPDKAEQWKALVNHYDWLKPIYGII